MRSEGDRSLMSLGFGRDEMGYRWRAYNRGMTHCDLGCNRIILVGVLRGWRTKMEA